MRVPSKARQLLGINEQPTRVPSKVAKVIQCFHINTADTTNIMSYTTVSATALPSAALALQLLLIP
jgi:hypothetical protein